MSKKKNLSNQENKPKSSFTTLFFLDKEEALILDSYLQYYNQIKHKIFYLINKNNQISIKQIINTLNINIPINNKKALTKQDIIKAYYDKYFNQNITYPFNKFNTHVTQKQNTQLPEEFNITGRQFNSIKKELEGIISSTLELRETHFKELTEDIKSTTKQINNWCKKQHDIINSIVVNIIKTNNALVNIKNNTSVNAKTEQAIKDNNIKIDKQIKTVPKQKLLNSLTQAKEKELTAIIKTQLLKIVKEYQYLLKEKHNNKEVILKPLIDDCIIQIEQCLNINTNASNNPPIILLEKEKESIKTKINSYCYAKVKEKSLTKKLKVKQNKYNNILWDKLTNTVSICFGSKKLFKQQFLIPVSTNTKLNTNTSYNKQNKSLTNNLNYLHENHSDVLRCVNNKSYGFQTRTDWKKQWDFKRNQHLNIVGAKAETTGNQSCIATVNRANTTNNNGSFNFDLRLPDKIINAYKKTNSINYKGNSINHSYNFYQGKYLQLKEIDFNEFNIVLETILMNQTTTIVEKEGLKKPYIKKEVQEAISYKISKNEKQPLLHKNLIGYTITFTVNTPKASLIKQGKERFKLSKKETNTTINQVNTKFDELDKKQTLDESLGCIPQGLTLGVIGIDLNYDHVALAETDRHGNLINTFNLYFNSQVDINNSSKINLKHKTIESQISNSNYNFLSKPSSHHYHVRHQSSDVKDNMLGNLVKTIIDYAKKVEKPIVIEDLDFTQKKKQMSHNDVIHYTKTGKRYKTMLSSFFYGTFRNYIERSCYKHDVELIKVNPVYSSLIGLINWSKRNNLTIHQAAALVIARRGQFSTEKKMYVEKVIKNKTTNKNSSNNGNTNKVVKVEVKEKLSFSYKGLICRIDLPVKPQAKGNNQALKQNIIRSQKTSTLVNQWKTVEQEVKKAKKEVDQLIFEKRKLKLTLIKQFKRNTIDENEFSLLS